MTIKLSTFKRAVRVNREHWDATRANHLNQTKENARLEDKMIQEANETVNAILDELGIDPNGPQSTKRLEVQARILNAINRAGNVKWHRVYDPADMQYA